jgi:phosphoribosylglycinamide formyltransferase 1
MIQLAVFASGAGSNAQRIIEHFNGHTQVSIALVVCNKPGAGVIAVAEQAGIPVLMIEKEQFTRGDAYTAALRARDIDFIVLAGFLWKIPPALVSAFAGKIVNIHPALLPKYGGKGMYGHFVHEAVIASGDTSSGISIHFVDELYDHGNIIFQASCPVEPGDTPATLAQKIHLLEHAHYPAIIEKTLQTVKS